MPIKCFPFYPTTKPPGDPDHQRWPDAIKTFTELRKYSHILLGHGEQPDNCSVAHIDPAHDLNREHYSPNDQPRQDLDHL